MTKDRCPVCTDEGRVSYRLRRHDRAALRCQGCGLTWLDRPLFSAHDHYEHYRASASTAVADNTTNASADLHASNIRNAIDDVRGGQNLRILEVGSGSGDLLVRLRRLGYEVEGVEPSDTGVRRSRERCLTVAQSSFEEHEPSGRYDVVVSTHVLEHVADVDVFFRAAHDVLSDGGTHIVVTPNGDAPLFRLLRRYWTYATPDEHRYIFTAAALREIGARHGFDVVTARTTQRQCGLIRGLVREAYVSARARRAGHATTQGRVREAERGQRQRVWDAVALVEAPILRVLNAGLRRRLLGDELLVAMRRTDLRSA